MKFSHFISYRTYQSITSTHQQQPAVSQRRGRKIINEIQIFLRNLRTLSFFVPGAMLGPVSFNCISFFQSIFYISPNRRTERFHSLTFVRTRRTCELFHVVVSFFERWFEEKWYLYRIEYIQPRDTILLTWRTFV